MNDLQNPKKGLLQRQLDINGPGHTATYKSREVSLKKLIINDNNLTIYSTIKQKYKKRSKLLNKITISSDESFFRTVQITRTFPKDLHLHEPLSRC